MVHHKAIGMQLICISSLGQPLNTTAQPTTSFQGVSELSLLSGRLLTCLRDSRPSRQVNITCQCFQTQNHCQKLRWLISSLLEQCLRSVVYFLVLLLGFASGWKSESLFRAGVITTGCSLALGCLSQTASLGPLQLCKLWLFCSLGSSFARYGFQISPGTAISGGSLCVLVLGFVYHRRAFAYRSLPW